ncbi:MAG: (d)CMP kinase [Bacteroidales bacterium]|jgi:cytidylate kinase|nr:(d)CMP kinase [Bacteroidales bacterium]
MDPSELKKIQIAVDGYSACGKSTLAKGLAGRLGYIHIDSGAMYRAVTLFAIQENIIADGKINKNLLIRKLPEISIKFRLDNDNNPITYLNEVNVEDKIREIEVSDFVSEISAIPEVRHKMVAIQQKMGENKGIVMDGRDIGTVVFPDAELKIFLIADINVRTQRRYNELKSKGYDVDFEVVKENLMQRDKFDMSRSESPLRQADDAMVFDNSDITKEEQLEKAYKLALSIIENEN